MHWQILYDMWLTRGEDTNRWKINQERENCWYGKWGCVKKPLTVQVKSMVFAQGIFLNIKYRGTHILVLLIMFLAGIGVCPVFCGIWYSREWSWAHGALATPLHADSSSGGCSCWPEMDTTFKHQKSWIKGQLCSLHAEKRNLKTKCYSFGI